MNIGIQLCTTEKHESLISAGWNATAFPSSGRTFLTFSDINTLDLDMLISVISSAQTPLQFLRFQMTPEFYEEDLLFPPMIAGQVWPHDTQKILKEKNTFSHKLNSSCLGFVENSQPMHLSRVPKGQVAAVYPDHLLFSKRFCELLAKFAEFRVTSLFCDNKELQRWKRIDGDQSTFSVSDYSFHYMPCPICGNTMQMSNGVVIGQWQTGKEVSFNTFSMGHEGHREGLVVSKDICKELKLQLRSELSIRPILQADSAEGKRMVEIIRRFETSNLWSRCKI